MRLADIDWRTISQAQAARLVGAADRAEQAAAARFNTSGSPDDESAWRAAFDTWENLKVLAICGERPA